MAEASGWGVLPLSVSFSGIYKDLQKQLVEPASKAGKQAGQSVAKEMKSGAEAAAKAVESAQYRQKKSTQELESAESKLTEQKLKAKAANLAVESAARKREEAESKGIDAIEKAEIDLAKKRAASEKAARDVAGAEEGVEKALFNSSKAAENLEKKQQALDKAQDESSDSAKDLSGNLKDVGDEAGRAGDSADGMSGKMKVAFAAVGAAAVAGFGAAAAGLMKLGTDFDDAYDTIRVGTGASGEAFEDLKDSAKAVAEEIPGMEGGFGQISSTLADLNTRLGLTGDPLEEMTSQFVQLQNMGVDADINEISAAMSQFGTEAEDMPGMMDSLFQISQATGLSMTELTSSLAKSGPALQEMGFGLEESAGLLGQLDKAGLNSEQMMGSMTKALQGFAKAGEDPQEALWGTISSIEELTDAGKNAEAIDLANSVFGPKGGAQFVAAVEDGQFAWDDFMGSIGATDDTILGVAAETADFAESWQVFKQKSANAIEPLAVALFDRLGPAIEQVSGFVFDKLIPAFEDTVTWVQESQKWLIPLSIALGSVATGLAAAAFQQKIVAAGGLVKWLSGATKASWGFNASLLASPMTWIVAGIAAVTAGLIYFFTQTETGQRLWSEFTATLSESWDYTVEKLGAGWAWLKENVFVSWGEAVAGVKESWQYTVDTVSAAWTWLTGALSAGWETIKTAVFDAWNWYVNQVKENWRIVTEALSAAWTFVKDTFTSVWNAIKSAVFDAWNTAVTFLRDTFNTIIENISSKWSWLRDQLSSVWAWVKDNVFGAFHTALDRIKSGFETTVDAIGTAWGWLKRKTAEPINFVIETVYNNGIKKAWDAVAGLVGLDDLPAMKSIGGFAQGTARIPGARTPYDNVHMVSQDGRFGISLRGGEGVLVPEAVDGLGEGAVNALNHAGIHGGKPAVDRVLNALDLGGFARGGFIDLGGFNLGGVTNLAGNLSAIQRSHAQFVGRFFPDLFNLTSAGRQEPGSFHDFGSMAATDWQAKDGQYATQMPTAGSKALARAIFTNFPNSAELIHHPLDGWQNINDGAPHNYGAGTNAGHRNHVHWATRSPLQFDGDNIVLTDAGGGGIFETITNMAKRLWDGVIDKIPGYSGDTGGQFAKLPGAFLKKTAGAAWDHVKGLADKMLSFGGGSGGGAEQWRDLSRTALRRFGYNDDTYLDAMVRQIEIESGGDPNAVNNWDSNAAKGIPSAGLLQVIDPTYRDVRNRYPAQFEGLPDDRMHPLTNLVAGIGALKRDWGGPEGGRWPTTGGYHDGGLMGAGEGWIHKTATEPEMVLSPKMTEAFIDWMKGTPSGESVSVVAEEISAAFRGEDFGMGELASYVGLKNAEKILDEVEWMGVAMGEVRDATRGVDSGVAGVGRYLGGNYKLAAQILNSVESISAISEEVGKAYAGGDWGYGELASVIGNEQVAKAIVDGAAALGAFAREMGPQLQKSGADYATTQATGALDVMGLGGLVPLGMNVGQRVADLAALSPVQAHITPNGVVVQVDAQGGDFVHVDDLQAAFDQIDRLRVEVTNRRPVAASLTRGGVL